MHYRALFKSLHPNYFSHQRAPSNIYQKIPKLLVQKMSQQPFHKLTYPKHDEVEDLEMYQPGGYHPVNIGDCYSDGRYRVVHKLGWGGYPTVWLAHDTHSCRYVALKVLVACKSEESTESWILQHLRQNDPQEHAGTTLVASLLDEFHISGPNGRHLCIATKPTRCNLGESKLDLPWKFPLPISRAITAQAIMGLQQIHQRGVIHGDLHPRNILLAFPGIDSMSVEKLYQKYVPPTRTEIRRLDGAQLGPGVPSHSVVPVWLGSFCEEVSDPRITISDFGEAWLNTDPSPREELHTPPIYLPPETTFAKDAISFPADIWTLACTIHEIMGERPLFECFFGDRDDVISEMISTLGLLPEDWWKMWEARGEYFLEDGTWRTDMKRRRAPRSMPLSERIQLMGRKDEPDFSAEEAESYEKMLRAMFQYYPEKRATAKEVAKSDWMTRWGVPSLRAYDIQIPCDLS